LAAGLALGAQGGKGKEAKRRAAAFDPELAYEAGQTEEMKSLIDSLVSERAGGETPQRYSVRAGADSDGSALADDAAAENADTEGSDAEEPTYPFPVMPVGGVDSDPRAAGKCEWRELSPATEAEEQAFLKQAFPSMDSFVIGGVIHAYIRSGWIEIDGDASSREFFILYDFMVDSDYSWEWKLLRTDGKVLFHQHGTYKAPDVRFFTCDNKPFIMTKIRGGSGVWTAVLAIYGLDGSTIGEFANLYSVITDGGTLYWDDYNWQLYQFVHSGGPLLCGTGDRYHRRPRG
jgi:hypothetical protein